MHINVKLYVQTAGGLPSAPPRPLVFTCKQFVSKESTNGCSLYFHNSKANSQNEYSFGQTCFILHTFDTSAYLI